MVGCAVVKSGAVGLGEVRSGLVLWGWVKFGTVGVFALIRVISSKVWYGWV
jgi:hypothetical protein